MVTFHVTSAVRHVRFLGATADATAALELKLVAV